MSVPNLDSMTTRDLYVFFSKYDEASLADAERLIGDRRKDYTDITRRLVDYAWQKLQAISARSAGLVKAAAAFEKKCEVIYATLPADLRW